MTIGPKHRIEASTMDSARLVTVSGEIDLASAPKLEATLLEETDRVVIVDLREVDFMDSTGLRSLLAGQEAVAEGGGRMILVFEEGPVERILDLTGLADRFEVAESVEAAARAAG